MNEIRLLALDIDGTILTKEKQLTNRTKSAIEAAAGTGIAVALVYAFTQTDAHHAIFIWYDIENFDFQSASGFCIFDIKWASDWVVATHVQKTEVLVININLTIIAVFGHEGDGFP